MAERDDKNRKRARFMSGGILSSGSGSGPGPGSAPAPSRRAALDVLRALRSGGGDPASLLHSSSLARLSPEDRRLTTELVYGVLRWRARLDFELARHSRRRLTKMHPDVLDTLRLGLYQLRHLERVPPHAAVDESVRLVKRNRSISEANFVNAVLRSILRSPPPEFPTLRDDPVRHLSVALSHPEWLVRRYIERLGLPRAERRCRLHNEAPFAYVRVPRRLEMSDARRRLAEENVEAEFLEWLPNGLRVTSGNAADTQLYGAGDIVIQDAGSQLVALLLSVESHHDVLDVCAAPGGKTSAIAEATERPVIALDIRPRRVRLLRETLLRLRVTNVHVAVADGRALPLPRDVRFPRILLDVPCSSLGTLRRNPDIKWHCDEADLRGLAALQRDLLEEASEQLATGGRLVYATCSTEPEENEDVIRSFLDSKAGSGFAIVDAGNALPEAARELVGEDGLFRTVPERDGVDGYFAAVLTRKV